MDVASLGSESLRRISELINKLQNQREIISAAIAEAEQESNAARKLSRKLSWLRRWVAPDSIAKRRQYEEDCNDPLEILNKIKESLIIDVEFAISEESKSAFDNVITAFNRVSHCSRVWDITSATSVDRLRTRSAASHELNMQRVELGRTHDSLLATDIKPPLFTNANGADLLLYPAFVAVRTQGRFALLDIREVQIIVISKPFIVADGDIPSDARIIDHTWRYVNKDGAPDRRFRDNLTIPVAEYYQIFFQGSGLNEGWMISDADAGIALSRSNPRLQRIVAKLRAKG